MVRGSGKRKAEEVGNGRKKYRNESKDNDIGYRMIRLKRKDERKAANK